MSTLAGWTYADIVDWDEDRDGPMPDEYDTECPRCGRQFAVWHAATVTVCECGCIVDPSTGEAVDARTDLL